MNFLFQNPLILIPVLSGFICLLAGIIMAKFPPKKINSFYGYRTNSSMKNQQRWDFAQKFSSIEMIKLSILLMLSGVIGLIIKTDGLIGMIIGLALLIMMVIILFFRVESAIKNEFKD